MNINKQFYEDFFAYLNTIFEGEHLWDFDDLQSENIIKGILKKENFIKYFDNSYDGSEDVAVTMHPLSEGLKLDCENEEYFEAISSTETAQKLSKLLLQSANISFPEELM
jgi:hypothetical protein